MAESSDVQILEKISTEVDESQFKIILSSQCIKAQAHLVDKLRKQSEQQKQICNFISNGNLKLETEIKLAEQEVKSILCAIETIKIANVELKKELLIAKERRSGVNERVNNGIKKYEELWASSKRRYESIPFIQNYIQIKNKNDILHNNVINLNDILYKVRNDINIRKIELLNLDRKHVIELAKFMVHERPKMLQSIQDKCIEIKELSDAIQELTKEGSSNKVLSLQSSVTSSNEVNNNNEPMDTVTQNSWPNLITNIDNDIMLPKLQLQNVDLDSLTNKLDQMKKVDSQYDYTKTNIIIEKNITRTNKSDVMIKDLYVSSYFQTNNVTEDRVTDCKSNKYSDKKLINILEDIKLDKMETFNIVSNIKQSCLQDVDMIKADSKPELDINKSSLEKISKPVENFVIEEIDLTKNQSQDLIIPPTQFLDLTQEQGNSQICQELSQKSNKSIKNSSQEKKVTFDTIVSVQNMDNKEEKIYPEEIITSPNDNLNVSTKSEDSYNKIKEIVFKKHNLELSPQFTYTKKNIPMVSSNNIVKSKFFFEKNNDNIEKNISQIMEIDDNTPVDMPKVTQVEDQDKKNITKNINDLNIQENIESQKDETVAGFLFTHGPQGIPDSLNVSISTTGYDEDADYPQCIDSSLLLSPKADVEMPSTSSNVQVLSQEVPNFLSGMRKAAFSFFGNNPSENKPDGNTGQNNFTFSFGGDEKKTRGGLFNMFR